MSKPLKIKLSIPEPCSENWDKMTQGEKGRFCSSCSNIITDFSGFTDKELVEYISKAAGKICGRFENTQLNRVIAIHEPSHTPIFRRLLFGTALAAGVAGTANGQTSVAAIKPTTIDASKTNGKDRPATDSTIRISGIVLDSATRQPVQFVNVYIERNPSKGIAITTAGTDGKFEFNINRNLIGKKVTISAQSFGYVDCPLKFIVTNSPITPVTVLMKPTSKHVNDLTDTMVLGMVSPTIKSINTDTIIKKVK